MFESKEKPVISTCSFSARMFRWAAVTIFLLSVSLYGGMAGYHYLENMAWIDALLNAAMILGGMGPVGQVTTEAGKIFASFYAIYSGFFMVICGGLFLAPIFHRVLHKFHSDD